MALDERRLAFIGAGHITNIILDNLVKAEKLHPHRVIASDPEKNKPISAYESLGDNTPVVRALPNPPSQIGMGIAALAFNPHVTDVQKSDIFELFASLGEYVVTREENINAVMALSSPAATYLFFQSLIDAGVRAGIDRETSTKVVYQTIVGAMEIWNQRQASPHDLLSEASTPGGISVESIFTLEQYAFRAALNEAINNAALKAEELGDAVQKT